MNPRNVEMQVIARRSKLFDRIIFFIWPFLSCFRAFYHYKSPWSKNIVWAFCVFFGFTLVVTEGGDANRYIEWFQFMGINDWSLNTFWGLMYASDTRYVDIAQPLISYLLSRFTQDPRVLLAVFGLVFGFFYSRNIWFLLDRTETRLRPFTLLLLIIFVLLIPIWTINGFRFWTASHVFLYGALPFLLEGDKKKLWIAGISILFHYSFMLPMAILLLYIGTGNRLHLFFYFFILSFFIQEINFQLIGNFISTHFPAIFAERAGQYISEDIAIRKASILANRSWHAMYYQYALRIGLVSLAVFSYSKVRKIPPNNNRLISLFSFALLFSGVFNILGKIPSVGRFLTVGNMLFIAFFFLYFQYNKNKKIRKNKIIIWLVSPCLLFYCIVAFRTGFDFIGLYTALGNPLTAFYGPGDVSLINIVKGM